MKSAAEEALAPGEPASRSITGGGDTVAQPAAAINNKTKKRGDFKAGEWDFFIF